MLFTISISIVCSFKDIWCTFRAYELFGLVFKSLLHFFFVRIWWRILYIFFFLLLFPSWSSALSMSSKVWIFAFIALIVIQVVKCKLRYIVEVLALGIFDALIQVKSFVFGPLQALIKDFLLKASRLLNFCLKPVVPWSLHPLVAWGT